MNLKFIGYTLEIHWKSIGGSFEMQLTYILNPLKSIGNTLEINSNPLEIDTKASRHRFCIQKARTPPMGGGGSALYHVLFSGPHQPNQNLGKTKKKQKNQTIFENTKQKPR